MCIRNWLNSYFHLMHQLQITMDRVLATLKLSCLELTSESVAAKVYACSGKKYFQLAFYRKSTMFKLTEFLRITSLEYSNVDKEETKN